MNKLLVELSKALTEVIVSNCKGKNSILLTMSGGMDTRLILSIMLRNGITPDLMTWDGSPNDIKIASKIAKKEGLKQIIVHRKTSDTDWLDEVNKVILDYDVVFYGELMSEVFNKFVRFTESERKLNDIIDNYFQWVEDNSDNHDRELNKMVFPCLDKKVMNIAERIPIFFRVYGYINRKIIEHNYPYLMKYPHTVVNMRYRLLEFLYWCFVPMIERWGVYE